MPALSSGTILLWSGSIASIPGGFVLCDGNNGTPDLRDLFLRGAGGAHAVGASGGSTQHNHTFTGDGHNHTHPGGVGLSGGDPFEDTVDTQAATGTTDNGSSLPPYYCLAFIMKT